MSQLPVYQFNPSQFSILKFLSSVIILSPVMAWFLVALVVFVFIAMSLVLSYHWRRFGIDTLVMARASILYFSVSAFLGGSMIISLAVYLNSL